MSSCDRDSYTGAAIPAPKRSNIAGLWTPRESFYRTAAEKECAAQYAVHPRGGGESWIVLRRDCPEKFLPSFDSQGEAVAVMQWLVSNDMLAAEAIGWLKAGNGLPYIELMSSVLEIANQESFLQSITWDEPTTSGYLPPLSRDYDELRDRLDKEILDIVRLVRPARHWIGHSVGVAPGQPPVPSSPSAKLPSAFRQMMTEYDRAVVRETVMREHGTMHDQDVARSQATDARERLTDYIVQLTGA